MKILVTGSTGLVGSALVPLLTGEGHEVVRLVRPSSPRVPPGSTLLWNPARGEIDRSGLEGFAAAVHLAGENIGEGRWNRERRDRIRRSREEGTRLLCDAFSGLSRPPRVLACASAIGYYGTRGEEILREESAPGKDFLAEVCRAWEGAAAGAAARGIRVVPLRFGVILSAAGGALAKVLPLFRLGLGGVVGSGSQYMSWISLEDAAGAIRHVLATESLSGPVNSVAPRPVTNREYTRTLAAVLRRPAIVPLPASLLRMALGEMADSLLLSSARVEPARLLATGYRFQHPDLETALRKILGRAKSA